MTMVLGLVGAEATAADPVSTSDVQRPAGTMSRTAIQRVIASHNPAIQDCYERQLIGDAKLQGTVQIELTIASDGRVSDAVIQRSSFVVDDVEACVVAVVRTMAFPAPKGGRATSVVYPFAFNAQGGTPHIQTRGIDATVAADVIFAQAPAFDRCAAQRTDAAAPMDTALRIRIRIDGTVTAEHVGLRPANDAVDACVEDVAKGLRFPPSSSPAVVAYPMQLRPPAAAPAPDAPSTSTSAPSSSSSTSTPSSSTSSTSSTSQPRSCAWP